MANKFRFLMGAILLALCIVTFAQGPVGNTVYVTLVRDTIVGSRVVPAGDYTIREVTSGSNPRVLEFTTNRGTKLQTTVTAVPMLQNTPPGETKLILDTESGQPRLSKIWIQGKDYGYEFPKEFSFTQSLYAAEMQIRYDDPNVAASARSAPAQVGQATVAQNTASQNAVTVTQANGAPVVVVPPATQAAPAPQVAQAKPQQAPTAPAKPPAQVAQAQPQQAPAKPQAPPQQVAQAQPQQPPVQVAQAPPTPAPSPAQDQPAAGITVPATGLGWADLLLAGFVAMAAGLYLKKRTA